MQPGLVLLAFSAPNAVTFFGVEWRVRTGDNGRGQSKTWPGSLKSGSPNNTTTARRRPQIVRLGFAASPGTVWPPTDTAAFRIVRRGYAIESSQRQTACRTPALKLARRVEARELAAVCNPFVNAQLAEWKVPFSSPISWHARFAASKLSSSTSSTSSTVLNAKQLHLPKMMKHFNVNYLSLLTLY